MQVAHCIRVDMTTETTAKLQLPDISRRAFTCGLGTSLLMPSPLLAMQDGRRHFKVYSALLHANQPDLRPYGIDPIYLFDRGIWKNDASRHSAPDPGLVAERIAHVPDDDAPLVMDFEFFQMRSREETIRSRDAMQRIAETFDRFAGNRPIGFYGYLPVRNYWDSIESATSPRYRKWQELNSLMSPLAQSIDMLFPSLYTFYNNPRQWQQYALAQVAEARRISNKPVVPFIWPDFHHNGKNGPREAIPRDFWRLQLNTLAQIADGLVIWGGWDTVSWSRLRWDDKAPWWIETQQFLRGVR